ncbi:glycosyl transferase family protein [Mycobacterium tuberculosis]|nr:glycosyl transferase family protein [Mycobacterium tuberculosis]
MSPQLCPKVSIVSTTHNQAGYARQAFDSFLDQQTDFPVEIIVADDASTDATRRSSVSTPSGTRTCSGRSSGPKTSASMGT